jgi:hypothetical protein
MSTRGQVGVIGGLDLGLFFGGEGPGATHEGNLWEAVAFPPPNDDQTGADPNFGACGWLNVAERITPVADPPPDNCGQGPVPTVGHLQS